MIYVLKCKIQMPKEGKSFQLSIISSKYVGKAMLRSLFSFFPSWNWCLLSTTFVPGWMDNGQRVFLEIILTRRKSQPHLLISILWGLCFLVCDWWPCTWPGFCEVWCRWWTHARSPGLFSPPHPGRSACGWGWLGQPATLVEVEVTSAIWTITIAGEDTHPQSPHSLALFSLTWTEGLFLFIYLFSFLHKRSQEIWPNPCSNGLFPLSWGERLGLVSLNWLFSF